MFKLKDLLWRMSILALLLTIVAMPINTALAQGSGWILPFDPSTNNGWWYSGRYYEDYTTVKGSYENRHTGVDVAIYKGTPIYASHDGVVEISQWGWNTFYGYGIFIKENTSSNRSFYAHLSQSLVSPGQEVTQGELIGYSGCMIATVPDPDNPGKYKTIDVACHLHWGYTDNNPKKFFTYKNPAIDNTYEFHARDNDGFGWDDPLAMVYGSSNTTYSSSETHPGTIIPIEHPIGENILRDIKANAVGEVVVEVVLSNDNSQESISIDPTPTPEATPPTQDQEKAEYLITFSDGSQYKISFSVLKISWHLIAGWIGIFILFILLRQLLKDEYGEIHFSFSSVLVYFSILVLSIGFGFYTRNQSVDIWDQTQESIPYQTYKEEQIAYNQTQDPVKVFYIAPIDPSSYQLDIEALQGNQDSPPPDTSFESASAEPIKIEVEETPSIAAIYGRLNGWGSVGTQSTVDGAVALTLENAATASSWTGVPMQPAIIFNVTGNGTRDMSNSTINKLIRKAGQNGIIVILDIQPSRNSNQMRNQCEWVVEFVDTYPGGLWISIDTEVISASTKDVQYCIDIYNQKVESHDVEGVVGIWEWKPGGSWLVHPSNITTTLSHTTVIPLYDGHGGLSTKLNQIQELHQIWGSNHPVGAMEWVTLFGNKYDQGANPQDILRGNLWMYIRY